MSKEEFNEYLAEHLFGIRRMKGKFKPFENEDLEFEVKARKDEWTNGKGSVFRKIPNYISNYQPVLEKLILTENALVISSYFEVTNDYGCVLEYRTWDDKKEKWSNRKHLHQWGDTLGEAICKVAVEYLKAKNK